MATSIDKQSTLDAVSAILQDVGGWPANVPPLQTLCRCLRDRYPDWVWPAGQTHVVASAPDVMDIFKVFTEPGGCFSPGVRSFGVSPWIAVDGMLHTPERLSLDEHRWGLEQGYLPVVRSACQLGPIEVSTELVATGGDDLEHMAVAYRVTLRGTSKSADARLYLAVRWVGPAGGLVHQMSFDGSLHVNRRKALTPLTPPDAVYVASLERDGTDISALLAAGQARGLAGTEESASGVLSAALEYPVSLKRNETLTFEFLLPIHGQPVPDHAVSYEQARQRECQRWSEQFGAVSVQTPDKRINEAIPAALTHMRWWMVHGFWRHSPVTYPLYWLRDAALMNGLYDRFGVTAITRHNADHIAENMYMGGFGAEADAPGQGLWVLVQHFRFSRDLRWLAKTWPRLVEKAEMIALMLTAKNTVRRLREPMLLFMEFDRNADLLCEPARDGLIVGRMDHHRPLFWVNTWALAGLRGIAEAADALGKKRAHQRYTRLAQRLQAALDKLADAELGQNERDFACLVWPTRAFEPSDARVQEAFEGRWRSLTEATGRYELGTEWTYFDVADAHNRLYLGERRRMWEILDYYLEHQHAKGMYLWREGPPDHADRSTTWSRIAGWIDHPTIIPHGWVGSEVPLLIRDMFVFEEGNSLVIGAGIPEEWMAKGEPISISGFNTYWGELSFALSFTECVQKLELQLPAGVDTVEVRLPGWDTKPISIASGAREVETTSRLGYPVFAPQQTTVILSASSR